MVVKYSKSDKEEVIKLLRHNTPEYFDASEETEFIEYLDNEIEDYFVVKDDSNIIGCGGINYFPNEKSARISWDMIHPDFQGKGIGKLLCEHRINLIKVNTEIKLIIVRTTQLVSKFYAKMGFDLEKVEKNFGAKGFDLHQMELIINTDKLIEK